MIAVSTKALARTNKSFKIKFEREIGRQAAFFRTEYDKWRNVIDSEYEKVLRHLHLIKSEVKKIDQGEVFERLLPWIILEEMGRRILHDAELRMFLQGVRYALILAGLAMWFNENDPRIVEAARVRAAALVGVVSDSMRRTLHGLTLQFIQSGWTVDKLAVSLRRGLTALPVSQRRIMREAAQKLAAGVSQAQVDLWISREMQRMTNYRALMIARTEASAAMNQGALMAYRNAGIKMVQWLALPTACEECAANDGHLFTVYEADGLLPYHQNCYCVWNAVVESALS